MSDTLRSHRTDWLARKMPVPGNHMPGILKPGKMRSLGLISNPLSGGNRKGMHIIREVMARHPQIYHREASTPLEIGLVLAEFIRMGVDVVAVNGGDGTAHAVLTKLFHRPPGRLVPLLAILRSGTASMIARDVGLRGSRRLSLKRLLAWAGGGCGNAAIIQRPVIKVERAPDQEPLYGMFFGAAGICQGIQFCLTRLHTKGLGGEFAAGVTLARFLISAARRKSGLLFPVPTIIGLDNEPQEKQDVFLILISTLKRLFLGFHPYWGTETAPLYYTAINAHPRHLLRTLPFLLRGRRSRFCTPEHGYFSRNVREARLTFTGNFTLDGQLYTPDTGVGRVIVSEGGTASFLRL